MERDKPGLRKELKRRYLLLTDAEREKKSEKILKTLFSLEEYKKAKTIMTYVSRGNEVSTVDIIRSALFEGKRVCSPVCSPLESRNMEAREIASFLDLSPGRFGILEPKEGTFPVPKNEIDLVIVPALAFSKGGSRLGTGGGYYDSFLSDYKGIKIGLCFDEFIIAPFKTDPYDVSVDIVITDGRVISACQEVF